MLLAAQWAKETPGAPALFVATVDHGLRPEARAEAESVALSASRLGLPHAILTWDGPKPKSRVQELARAARYRLLAAHAARHGASHLLTGHHAGDQAETILFRLARGSGLGGLAGMRREVPLGPGLVLMRPFLGLAKPELLRVCETAGESFADDPSNHDLAFARVRLRAAQDAARQLGLDPPVLLRLAARLARAEDALEAEAQRRLALADAVWTSGQFSARLAAWRDAKPEIVIRCLRHAFEHCDGGARPVRLDRLESLAARLQRALLDGSDLTTSLHGTKVMLGRDTMLTIAPEAPRQRGRRARTGTRRGEAPEAS